MANSIILGTKRIEDATRTRKPVLEKIIPSSGWTEDSNGICLWLDLPGFKKQQLKAQAINSDHIKVSGNRAINEKKSINFELSFKLAQNSDIDNITATFDGEILYVTIPKLIVEERGPVNINSTNSTHKKLGQANSTIMSFSEETIRKWEDVEVNNNLRSGVLELLSKNKGIVATAVAAFSIGLLVSRKLKIGD